MGSKVVKTKPYDILIGTARQRDTTVEERTLEEEADSDRGRVLFSAPFRRLQNKAQVFSLESNAAVRSRLTHSLEVSSIGRYVTQQAIKLFSSNQLADSGIAGKERPLLTFVETACLLHDVGNPPFGHFGEIAISEWFDLNRDRLELNNEVGGSVRERWNKYFCDFVNFDGNPQGLRIATKLQPSNAQDLYGLNLTATTLAATLKYPCTSDVVGQHVPGKNDSRKKAGYFRTEEKVVEWIWKRLGMTSMARHPLVYLMEAADDIAYCVSDIEDGIEKGIVASYEFADYMLGELRSSALFANGSGTDDQDHRDVRDIINALKFLLQRRIGLVAVLSALNDFRSAVVRLLARHAGRAFRDRHEGILKGEGDALLRDCEASLLLKALNNFAKAYLYSSAVVRSREITGHAVLHGLLNAYLPLMSCDEGRFTKASDRERRDSDGKLITRESSLLSRIPPKHFAVYREEVRQMKEDLAGDFGAVKIMERIHRMRLVVDYISGMTDEFALQTFQLVSGMQIAPLG